jgi:hypothetical protein
MISKETVPKSIRRFLVFEEAYVCKHICFDGEQVKLYQKEKDVFPSGSSYPVRQPDGSITLNLLFAEVNTGLQE